MAQSGKVLHLYVEVRSLTDEEGNELRNIEGTNSFVLHGPDVLPQSQHRTLNTSHGQVPPVGVLHKGATSTQSLASNKPPSRHSVSFQLHPEEVQAQPPSRHRQSLPYDEINQLLSALPTKPNGGTHNLVRTRSSESEPYYGRESRFFGHFTAPPTPSGFRRGYGQDEEGKRSVVSYSYIEKANVRSVESQHSSLCQSVPENPFRKAMDDQSIPLHLRKRLSDPLRFNSWDSFNGSNHNHTQTGPSCNIPSPNLRRATLDSIAREATLRALAEFGSPQLRRKLAGSSLDAGHDNLHREQPQCRSWSGTPVMPRSTRTLPINTKPKDLEQLRTFYGIPRSPATDQLSAHARQSNHTISPPSSVQSQGVLSHSVRMGDESPCQAYRHGPVLPSCKPTAIQHEIPTMTITQAPESHQKVSQCSSERPQQTPKVNFSLPSSSNKPDAGSNKLSGRKGISPATSPEMARKLAEEATKLSIIMEARRSPSPTPSLSDSVRSDSPRSGRSSRESHVYATYLGSTERTLSDSNLRIQRWSQEPVQASHHSGQISPLFSHKGRTSPALPARLHHVDVPTSPVSDPHQDRADMPGRYSPVLYRPQPPQYRGENRSTGLEHKHSDAQYDTSVGESPDTNRRHCIRFRNNTQANRSSQQQCNSIKARDGCSDPPCISPIDVSSRQLDKSQSNGPAALGSQENHCKVSVYKELKSEGLTDGEQNSALSQSSSGVTGSLGDGPQPDRDCISPETSSQSSQRSSDTENMSSQVESESPLRGPSLHSQKIARAKWEFLFGKSLEDHHGVKVSSTAPSSGYSSDPPTPNSLSSLPTRFTTAYCRPRTSFESKKALSCEVHQVELELVNSTSSSGSPGSSPRTGVVKRTIKYSETDLDAVPLRCYRETDIDELILAEKKEVDSAFGSIQSVLGTSGTSSGSLLDRVLCPHANGEEEEQLLDEEVVSWASVRMHGDRKRQHASQDGEEVFSRLLKGSPNCTSDSHNTLKSPVTVDSPRRTSVDGLDSFSRHFESIMESHRAKGTSYSSLDSVDITSSGPPIFTFDLPTLTPEIQSQISESAKQIIELSFAPLARPEGSSFPNHNTVSEASQGPTGTSQSSVSEDESESSSSTQSENHVPAENDTEIMSRERTSRPVSLSDPEVGERLALGSNETIANGNKADLQAAKRLAKRLYNLDGFRRSDVARHLSKNNEFSQMVAEEYLSYFNFSGLTVDQALRVFLRAFALVGETQERERVLSHFSRRYLQCNPNTIPNEDSVHTLTCALMLLNTDLHGHNVGKRMSCTQFIGNLEGLNNGHDFPKELLKALYNSIKNEKLQWTIDEEELRKSFSELGDSRTDSASHTMKRITSGGNPLVSLAQQSSAQVYKNGFLVRKVHADSDGKKTPRGKRGWKSFYAILKGLVLYLQKGEYRGDKQLSDEDLKNAVSIHHSLAMRAADYSKRPNVFYLRTADWRVFLFQAPNAEQMQSWITRINTVAAMFSAPPFPAAIGSQKKFSRPLLPGSSTKLSQVPNSPLSLIQEEQVQSHEARFRAVTSELQELRAIPTERRAKGKEQEESKQREEYLEFEKTRYGTYAMLLRAKIRMGEADLAAFESRLLVDSSLQRAHSSPTLPQDSSHASGIKKTKQGEGQRHSQKQAVKQ